MRGLDSGEEVQLSDASETLRCLVACPGCRRQYDAGGLAAGSRFRCSCGVVVEVPRFRAQDAAVVRCSSCGAPREHDARLCAHCGADFTLREQDVRTLCPACMARVSDRARYCHNCGTPIVPQGRAGTPTKEACPACGGRAALSSRSLGQPPIAVLECPSCAGLWLGSDAFRLLVDKARDAALPDLGALVNDPTFAPTLKAATGRSRDGAAAQLPLGAGSSDATGSARGPIAPSPSGNGAPIDVGAGPARADGGPPSGVGAQSSFYRPCPECGKMMNRRNFGQTSGIVLDVCKVHGLWFDAAELSAVLRWIHEGGEKAAAERRAKEEREAERLKRFKVEPPVSQSDRVVVLFPPHESPPRSGLEDLLGLLFDL